MSRLGTIPFSTFVKVVSAGVSPTFTFNRLNALVISTTETPTQEVMEYSNLSAVAEELGANSKEYAFATTYFGYVSKNAKMPERLTIWNYNPNGLKATLKGKKIKELALIKKNGSFKIDIDGHSEDVRVDLQSANSFADVAQKIETALTSGGSSQQEATSATLTVTYDNASTIVSAVKALGGTKNGMKITTNKGEKAFAPGEAKFNSCNNMTDIIGVLNGGQTDIVFAWSEETRTLTVSAKDKGKASTIAYAVGHAVSGSEDELNTTLKLTQKTGAVLKGKGTDLVPGSKGTPKANVSFDIVSGGLVFRATEVGTEHSISFATSGEHETDLSELLCLTEQSGAKVIPGVNASTLVEVLNKIGIYNGNYFTISSLLETSEEDIKVMSEFAKASIGRYMCVAKSDDINLKSTELVFKDLFGNDGMLVNYANDNKVNALTQAVVASIDYSVLNGQINCNFIKADGFASLPITTETELNNINLNKVNCTYNVGGYGQAQLLYGEGNMFGTNFTDVSGYAGNSWLKAKVEIAVMNMFISNAMVSLRGKGSALTYATIVSVINEALKGGIIVATHGLTDSERNVAMEKIGKKEGVDALENTGYFLRIEPISDDDIKLKRVRASLFYTRNTPTNRVELSVIVFG